MTHDTNYLRLLSEKYPTIESVTNELVSLRAIMHLPKGTEYYFSDLHGEHEAFIHLLRSGSGVIREKIDTLFRASMLEEERAALAALVYYPSTQMARMHKSDVNYDDWCAVTINRLVVVACEVSAKYTRSKVRRTMDERYAGIIEELMNTDATDADKRTYYREMIDAVIRVGCADGLIKALCHLIQQMTVDQLHIIGDIFDRGPRADRIIDELMKHHDVDIQWGNHDVSWIGAMCGNPVCLMSVLRIAISYNGFDVLEDGYGINLRPLSMFAATTYADDPCTRFMPHVLDENEFDPVDPHLAAKMHKAVAVMLFKLEGQLIRRHPEYGMNDRLLLDKIDRAAGTVTIGGQAYPMLDTCFPTLDPADPYALTEEEQGLVDGFLASFRHSERLRTHIDFIVNHGAMYKVANGKLLYHGCMPLEPDGSFSELSLRTGRFAGRALLDHLEMRVRRAYHSQDSDSVDLMWYLWCGSKSPVFGKDRMTSFERYFVEDKALHKEPMNPYYQYVDNREFCERLMEEFGLDPQTSHIVNGHVPVKHGETPIKAGGRLFVIDGGISKAYRSKTGIAGYTLISSSHEIQIAEHKPFHRGNDLESPETYTTVHIVERMPRRLMVADTDAGEKFRRRAAELEELLQLYRQGVFGET
ncbi:MAG: fructose-1,6-bisphosphatase [Clostridiales bacterium]|nr:fructose-1,6-bisphosphatase [Butyricicoccus pullicaecorum]MCI6720282.1 fructose-1,6-bisphosphatase [Clostridiales bacterium]